MLYRFWRLIRKNGFSAIMGIVLVTILVSPDAKSWVLRQLMVTGLFNASINSLDADSASRATINFDFEDGKGEIQSISSLQGKVVFINFWASWCPPCRAELPSIEKLYSAFGDNPDIFFLLINEDSDLLAAKEYLENEKYSLPFYKVRSKVPDVIYSGTLPTTIVLDKRGQIRFQHEGFANYGSEKFLEQLEELMKE